MGSAFIAWLIQEGQEEIMAELIELEASLLEVKESAETASAAVLAALAATSDQLADLQGQIDVLVAGAITQEQIDALAIVASDADIIIDAITAAVTPAVPVDVPVEVTEPDVDEGMVPA